MAISTEFLNKAVQKKQGSLAFAWLADREFEAGNAMVADEILDEGLSKFPDSVPGLFVKAKVLLQQNKSEDASRFLQLVLEKDPLHLAAQKSLIQVSILLHRGNEAVALVTKLRELDSLAPDFPTVPESIISQVMPVAVHPTTVANEFMIEREQLFASLEDAFLEESVAGDEKSAAELQTELEAALASTPRTESEEEYFPADDPSEPSGAVSHLFSQMFGGEEAKQEHPAPPEATAAPVQVPEPPPIAEIKSEPAVGSFFSSFAAPAPKAAPAPEPEIESASFEAFSAPVPPPVSETPAPSSSGVGGVDLASALNDLFGEDDDELPIEKPAASSSIAAGAEPLFDSPVTPQALPESRTDDGLKGGIADALGDMFGTEEDLPVEGQEPRGPVAELQQVESDASESGSLFEKTPEVASKSADDLSGGVADALGDMFGMEEDLPVEGLEPRGPLAESPAVETSVTEDALFDKTPELAKSTSNELSDGVSDALGDMFGEEADMPVEASVVTPEEMKDASPAISEPQPVQRQESSDELSDGVANALGDMFGEEEDAPVETSRGATTMEDILGGSSDDSSIQEEPGSKLELQSLADSIYDEPTPVQAQVSANDDFREGVASALGGLFGDLDDELPMATTAREESISKSSEPSPFADLLAGEEEAHDEGAVLTGDLAQSLIQDPIAPVVESELAASTPSPVAAAPKSDDDSFSGGMSNALTDLFGAELDEDLSDLMEEKTDAAGQGSTWTLGELYLEQGHASEALQVFQELLVADPANEALRQKIAEVQQRVAQTGSQDSE